MKLGISIAALALLAAPAMAQVTEAAAGAQAIAVIGGGGGDGGGSRFSGVATTPDAIAPSGSSMIGGGSCIVPATSDAVSVIFVSYGGARW